ncbi:hypothetical protein M422DRAFT_169160, partial [Sphaerobolus stellatus SS14]
SINALGATSNIVITIIMCWLLSNSRTGSRRTDTVVMRLIMYTVNTGLLVSLAALLTLVTAAARPHTFIYAAFYFLIPGLYLNSMLASLNARHSISQLGAGNNVIIASGSRRTAFDRAISPLHDPHFKFLSGSGIHVHRETVTSEPHVSGFGFEFSLKI